MSYIQSTTYLITERKGNTLKRTFRLKNADNTLFNITGSEFVFRARTPEGNVIRRSTSGNTLVRDDVASTLSFEIPADETSELPEGAVTPFELERRIAGHESTVASGFLNMLAGVNDDVLNS